MTHLTAAPSRVISSKLRLPQLGWHAILWFGALLVLSSALVPVFYLLFRVVTADQIVWEQLFRPTTTRALLRTVQLAVGVVVASATIAIPFAWLTTRTDLPFRKMWVVLGALPLVIPSYVGAYLMIAALGPKGVLQQWLEGTLGITRLPEIYGHHGALLVLTLLCYPYIFLSVRAALVRMNPLLEEASRGLGEGPWRTFVRVTLPQLRPAVTAGSLLVALYVVSDFGAVSLLRYDTFTRLIYIQYLSSFDRTGAAALSLILVALALAILALETLARRRSRYYDSTVGASGRPHIIRLGIWRWPALLFTASVALFALLLPAGSLGYWLIRGLQAGEMLFPVWVAAKNTLLASLVTALAAVVASLPIAYLSVRRPGLLSRLLARATYLGFGLPGIVVALALVYIGANHLPALYQSFAMLIAAYLILFLPQAVGAVRSSLMQAHPHLEEAARSLGRKPLAVFRSITLPIIWPGMGAGAALVFLTTMKELPATLILGPFGFSTLSTSIWSALSEAYFARAAAPALLLILLSSVPLALLIIGEHKDKL